MVSPHSGSAGGAINWVHGGWDNSSEVLPPSGPGPRSLRPPAVTVEVLPDDRAALSEADAHSGEPVCHLRLLGNSCMRWIMSRGPEEAKG